MRRIAASVALLALGLAGGCADEQERYCTAVEDHQEQLSEILAGGGTTALLDALDPFRELADEAPTDIRDEWAVVTDRIAALRDALATAGVDPATYDAEQPPADLADADRDRIEQAARDLGSEQTQRALADLEQQALDVCGTPLSV